MKTQILCAVILALVCSTAQALSGRKTDIITLYNGDKVTGEIKHLFGGLLNLSTDSMGTIQIEWQEIARVESRFHYEIRLTEGRRYYGTIEDPLRPGEMTISDVYGDHDTSYLEVVEIRPVSISLKDQIDVYLAIGYSYDNASSVTKTNLNGEIGFENEKTRNSLSGRINLTDTESDSTSNSRVDLSRSVWTNREDVFRTVLGTYETNDELGLDYRFSIGGGLGRHIKETQRYSLEGMVGMQVLTEKDFLGEKQESIEGIVTAEFTTWKFKTPELHIKLNGAIYPSITESGRIRGDTDIKIKWEIIEDLFWDITAFGTYDNKSADESRFDYGISTGVGWEY